MARTRSSTEPERWLAFGVDPGASGAVALVGSQGFADGRVLDTKDPEAINSAFGELMTSAHAFYDLAVGGFQTYVYIEDVYSRPGEGHVGVFSFGRAKGVPHGWFEARGIPARFVSPQAWQRRFFGTSLVKMDKDDRKAAILAKARKRWPEASLGRVKDEAVAAALYIALAGRETAW